MKDIRKLSAEDIQYLIDSLIVGRNAERNRYIMRRKLIDGITFEKLAEEKEVNLSPRQVQNIVHKCEQIIFNDKSVEVSEIKAKKIIIIYT